MSQAATSSDGHAGAITTQGRISLDDQVSHATSGGIVRHQGKI
jgi:hypothetical protein